MQPLPPIQSLAHHLVQRLIRQSYFITRPQLLLRLPRLPGGGATT